MWIRNIRLLWGCQIPSWSILNLGPLYDIHNQSTAASVPCKTDIHPLGGKEDPWKGERQPMGLGHRKRVTAGSAKGGGRRQLKYHKWLEWWAPADFYHIMKQVLDNGKKKKNCKRKKRNGKGGRWAVYLCCVVLPGLARPPSRKG